eukprot:4636528-Alexandrium_andersonii.AAC.1
MCIRDRSTDGQKGRRTACAPRSASGPSTSKPSGAASPGWAHRAPPRGQRPERASARTRGTARIALELR